MSREPIHIRLLRFLTEPETRTWPDPDRNCEPTLDDWILHGPRLR